MRTLTGILIALGLLLAPLSRGRVQASSGPGEPPASPQPGQSNAENMIYLPLTNWVPEQVTPIYPKGPELTGPPRVNVPYFNDGILFNQTAVFWFGRITPTENYADARVGYTKDELYIRLAVVDRNLWYNPHPSAGDLTNWDSATLYLSLGGNQVSKLDGSSYRFDGQLSWWEDRAKYQASYRGQGGNWEPAELPFTTEAGWRGSGLNKNIGTDRGWTLVYHIPFNSLGLSGPPVQGTIWGIGVVLHDRDDSEGTPISDKIWPKGMKENYPKTWGQLSFGWPAYIPSQTTPAGETTIRNKLDGAVVVDGEVGGGAICGAGMDFWSEWGERNYTGKDQVNIQNQSDIGDWPCFSKFYITFPLNSIPNGKTIISAKLTLYQFGNAGGGQYSDASASVIQVFSVAKNWDEAALTWNNAPLAKENISSTRVEVIQDFPGWPGVPNTWDVSRAVAEAYIAGAPLRLAFYSADSAYHSGKYFSSSDVEDWDEGGRPTLDVVWGNP